MPTKRKERQMNREKYDDLLADLKSLKKVAIAFSGGVDSTFLAKAAHEALGNDAVAITIDSPYIPRWELEESIELAKTIGIRHEIIKLREIPNSIAYNPSDRCYLCKKVIFSTLLENAHKLGISILMDGSNFDDTKDYRPGMVALKELKIKSPLLELQWTKNEIREASKLLGLTTYDKPAYACLLTRLQYNQKIEASDLLKIEKSEVYMMGLGFKAVRVRCHGDLARIEVSRAARRRLFDEDLLDEISSTIKGYGFNYVAIEAAGYSMGSFNRQIGE
jgi:uncharacterized protein